MSLPLLPALTRPGAIGILLGRYGASCYAHCVSPCFDPPSDRGSRFVTTRWDVVLASAETHAPGADEALSDLCRSYWPPLYTFVRRRGFAPEDAEDLVQGFFAQFLQNRAVKKADRLRGKFRTFLLRSMENFLANEWDRAAAAKRGGRFQFVPLEDFATEEEQTLDRFGTASPEAVFDRRWAQAIIDAALKQMRAEAKARGKATVFDELKSFLNAEASYDKAAAKLQIPVAAVKTAIHRLRSNFRLAVRREVARTVECPTEVDDELRYLSSVLATANAGELMPN